MAYELKLNQIDAWALQSRIKLNAFIAPQAPFSMEDVMGLRKKLNSAICTIENTKQDTVEFSVSEQECWIIDTVIDRESYAGAKQLLLQVYRIMWEHEFDIQLVDNGQDKIFHPSMLKGWDNDLSM